MLEIARDRDGARRDRMAAVEWLVVRGWGRAPDVDPELKVLPSSFDWDRLTIPEAELVIELLKKASADE